ncbi:hypothetical protein QBC44DRAFT_349633 [Cladorrhinum sp. PSN332]|nr:hypothetical protein QBC44DRAFT_349633 [Cladorrhinum sp. PSN332]
MEREPKRRRRPPVSCILCRQRKIRCNRESPCQNCIRSKNAECVYRDGPKASQLSQPTRAKNQESTATSSTLPNGTYNDLVFRHEESTNALNTATPAIASVTSSSTPAPASHFETTSTFAGSIQFQTENVQIGNPQTVTRSVSHKTRLFGQSHWINAVSLIRDMFDVIEPHTHDESSNIFKGLRNCKKLAKAIKQHRAPPWPCLSTSDLPSRSVSDQLVECYIQAVEPIYRILHIPSFRKDYETLWLTPGITPDRSFLIQVKLVLAIGATTYDATFSLKPQAIQWVYEGQTWLSAPEFKHRLGIQSIQSTCLLMFAREATGVGEDLIWASVGSLLRTAMYMGLHRDSAGLQPTTTLLAMETRRRLWNTILELAVHSSMISGGAPLINLENFDTEAPGNFNDDELTNGDLHISDTESRLTQTSTAIALRKTFPQRLAIAKFLNEISSKGSYQETVKLDTELRSAYKDLTRSLQAQGGTSSSSTQQRSHGLSDFELRSLDLMMRRYLLSLHVPFFGASLSEASFAFSRKVAVESALRLWRAVYPAPISLGGQGDLLSRQVTCGSGVFRTAGIQAFIIVASEIKALLKEEDSLAGPSLSLRPDLLAVLEDAKIWTWECIKAGETNIKAHLCVQMVCSQVKGLIEGREGGDVARMVVSTAEECEARCQGFFEEVVGGFPGMMEEIGNHLMGSVTVTPEFAVGDWDYLAPESFLEPELSDPLNWSFW